MIRGDLVGMVHELKIEKRFFDDILSGLKRFELSDLLRGLEDV